MTSVAARMRGVRCRSACWTSQTSCALIGTPMKEFQLGDADGEEARDDRNPLARDGGGAHGQDVVAAHRDAQGARRLLQKRAPMFGIASRS